MDKNIYNMKVEKIQKQAKLGDYETAAKICDTVDWSQVSSVRMLALVSSVYEHVGNYDAAIDILLMAYEEAPVGRRFLYKLTELAIASGNIREAEEFYKNYLKEAPEDNSRYILRYLLAEAKGEGLDKRITILETYKKYEFEEEWAFRLAVLYYKADRREECVALCDEIILWFGVGPYVDMAMELKEQYEPLSDYQRERRENKAYYEENLNRMAREAEAEQVPVQTAVPVREEAEVPAYSETAQEIYYEETAAAYEEELPKVVISDESNGIYMSEFDQAAFVAEDEIAVSVQDPMANTREVVNAGGEASGPVFHRVEASENATLEQSLGALVQDMLREEQQETIRTEFYVEQQEEQPVVSQEELPPAEEEELPVIAVAEETPEEAAVEPEVDAAAAFAEEIFREEIPSEVTEEVPAEELPEQEALPEIQIEQLELVWDDLEEEIPEQPKGKDLIFLGTPSSAEGIHMAVDALRKAYEAEGGDVSQVAKISGGKLNMKGLIKSLPNLVGKDLIIDNANSLDDAILYEIEKVRTEMEPSKRFVLMDRPAGIYKLKERMENLGKAAVEDDLPKILVSDEPAPVEAPAAEPVKETVRPSHPEVKVRPRNRDIVPAETSEVNEKKEEAPVRKEASKPSREPKKPMGPILPEGELDEDMELTEEQFIAYIKRYAAEIDCVIEEVAVLALYKVIEEIQEDGDRLTVGIAEDVVEEAADEAERKTLRGVFGSRYDKEGRLILKERHF